MSDEKDALFSKLKDQLLNIDPVYYCEKYLTLDGHPFRLNGNGYKPLSDIYRYIGVKALEPNAKPVIMVKGRQVGGTTMACALEMYFMGSGIFGVGDKPPIRVIHAFPQLELAAAYSKTKLSTMINQSVVIDPNNKKNNKPKTHMQSLLDTSSATNDSLHFKQFTGGNHLWIESTGLDADRLMGRMLCLETDIPTPNGFIKLKDLKEGDQLFDEDGNICNVTKLHPIDLKPESYRITFDDGTIIDACADHLWLTSTKRDRINSLKGKNTSKVKTTKDILNTLKIGTENNHCIPTCSPINYSEKDLILDPYLLGLWLGDGDAQGRIESAEPEVFDGLSFHVIPSSIGYEGKFGVSKSNSYRVDGLTSKLVELKLLKNTHNKIDDFYNKHIPDIYMKSSFKQRLSLLQGLLDSDGHCDKNGNIEFVQVRENLAMQVLDLVLSLGIKAKIYKRSSKRYGKILRDKYRIRFTTSLPVFRLQRKLNNIKSVLKICKNRYITNVEQIDPKPMRCITVDSKSHLFLVTKNYIATHNTADAIFFDECFPYLQQIATSNGKMSIGRLYHNFVKNKELPKILSFNESSEKFEYKNIKNVWKKNKRDTINIKISGRKIECTENHKFLTENGWLQIKDVKIGSLIKSFNDTSKNVDALNDDQIQIVLGSFLGDGHLYFVAKSRYRLSEVHGMPQSDYAKWKSSMLNCDTFIVKNNGYSGNDAVKFTTKTFGMSSEFPNSKTSCPQWIIDKIDARAIAIWFMDDGSKNTILPNNNGSATISTCSFDEDTQIRLVNKLRSLGIECSYKKYDYFSIYFSKNGFKSLCNLIRPFVHESMTYKIDYADKQYAWNNKFKDHSWLVLDSIESSKNKKTVYDIEVEDNHNFILSPNSSGEFVGGPIAHNCQKTTDQAIGNALKILTTAKYGNKGIQVFFGTPRRKGSSYHKRWITSTQQYFQLGCESCGKHFPLYTPGSDEWESIWLHGFIVKCTHCGHEQDKRNAADRGKWVGLMDENDPDCKMIGFHINQIYMPFFTKEDLIAEKPGIHPINTERVYQNEVLGEFFQGDSSPITPEEIRESCADVGRKFSSGITPSEDQIVVVGIDYGKRSDLEQMANPDSYKGGQSYSTAVVLASKGPGLLSIEFATKFKRNDMASKRGIIDQIMRKYGINLAVGDIGFSQDFSEDLHNTYGDRYLVSRAHPKVNNYVKFSKDAFPKEIVFERDHYIGEMYDQMKKGMIRFPFGDYEKIAWLIEHCASMEIKPSISKYGDPSIHYVKGGTPNDGFMALLNAYIAYKFILTNGFADKANSLNNINFAEKNKPLAIVGYAPWKV